MASEAQVRIYKRSEAVVFRMTTGEFGGLSNMAPNFPLEINGTKIATVEALYQACRFPHRPDVQALILDQSSPMTAKMKSKRYREGTRADWQAVRVKIMRWCLRVKLAQNWACFSALLLKTDARPIVEESQKDDFWGAKSQDDGNLEGRNVLGRLLMELREKIRTEQSETLQIVAAPTISDFLILGKAVGAVGPHGREFTQIQPSMFS